MNRQIEASNTSNFNQSCKNRHALAHAFYAQSEQD